MWQVRGDDTDTADKARGAEPRNRYNAGPEEAACRALNAPIPFSIFAGLDRVDSWLDFLPALTEWASWLLQNNPDLLTAYFLFAGRGCARL